MSASRVGAVSPGLRDVGQYCRMPSTAATQRAEVDSLTTSTVGMDKLDQL